MPQDRRHHLSVLFTWAVTAAWFATPLLVGLSRRFDELASPCLRLCDDRSGGVLLGSQASALRDLGMPLSVYASLDVAREVALVVVCIAVGTIMVLRVGSVAAQLAAAALLATGAVLVPETTTVALDSGGPWIAIVVATAFVLAVSVFFFLLPDGQWHPRWIRWVIGVWVGVAATWTVVSWPRMEGVVALQFVTMLVLIPPGIVAQAHRVRTTAGTERQQAKWVLLGAGGWLGSLVLYLAVIESGLLSPQAPGVIYPVGYLLYGIALTAIVAVLPIAWSFAVLRHRLWDVDRLIGRSTLALMVAGAALAVFGIVVAVLGLVVGARWEVSIPIAALLWVVLFVPFQARVRSFVQRLLYGERGDPYDMLARLWTSAHEGSASLVQLERLVRQLLEGLHLPAARLELSGENCDVADLWVGLSQGELASRGESTSTELSTGGQRIGTLTVWPRTGEHRLARRDVALMQAAAAPITHVAAMIRTTEELRRSRTDIISARYEERRSLQHDLHDDLGPTIAIQSMLIDSATEALVVDPHQAGAMLSLARQGNEHLVSEVRRLATDLHPPVLDRLGFLGALEQLVAAVKHAGPPAIDLDVDLTGEVPVAIQSTAYRIASEALANAVRHADATRVAISLRQSGSDLLLTVADDGRGGVPPPGEAGAGTGLASMRQRARELGGILSVVGHEGEGTTVTLRVELP